MSFGDNLLNTTNWIHGWYDDHYIEGGLNPIGWDHPWDRYFLSLFWSVQTITSIGYGNITPVTFVEVSEMMATVVCFCIYCSVSYRHLNLLNLIHFTVCHSQFLNADMWYLLGVHHW